MDTSKIKAIFSAIENKSMSKAAQALSYTPSAMSHITDSVEKELGVRILKRTPFGVEWSDEGRQLEPLLLNLIKAEEELRMGAQALVAQNESVLRIGTYSSIASNLLPELLAGFKAEYPNVQVSITIGNSIRDWLSGDKVDVTFDDIGAIQNSEWIPIMNDPYVAVLPNDILPLKKTVKREELSGYPYIAVNDSHTSNYFENIEFSEVIRFASVDDSSVISMVKEGIGVSVLPTLTLKKHAKGIHTAKLEPALYRPLGVSYRKSSLCSFGVSKFIEYIKKHYKNNK